ncbi:hypothetical protein, partial [Paraburkholderia sp.]|uniref:hypothetical protein n=1 Tax=Paraburkholderia sp. TaxID=1926495 RepID=UPI002F4188E9
GKRLHDRSKKIAAPNVFFPACSVRIEARAGSPWFFLRGRDCGKALNYKGIRVGKSKCPMSSPLQREMLKRSGRKKTRTSGSGLIHQRRRWRRQRKLQAYCNDAMNYMSRPCATQGHLHCEIAFHIVAD